MQKHPTHKNASGFTLIELVIAVAIIGILTSVAVLGYNQYKVRAYDAHSKQVLHNILLQCNAFWLEHDALKACEHPTEAEVYVAGDEIVIKFPAEDLPDLPGGSQENFCATAKHNSSPNTYSIDGASLISDTEDCGGAGGSAPKLPIIEAQTFETYKPSEEECSGEEQTFYMVDPDGEVLNRKGRSVRSCTTQESCAPIQFHTTCERVRAFEASGKCEDLIDLQKTEVTKWGPGINRFDKGEGQGDRRWRASACEGTQDLRGGRKPMKPVYAHPHSGNFTIEYYDIWRNANDKGSRYAIRYNFATGMWINAQGHEYKNGLRVE